MYYFVKGASETDIASKLCGLFEEKLPEAHLIYYDITDSTNTRAIEYAKSTAALADAFFIARSQSAGRGRRGRSFSSEPGGLYMTYLTYPDMPADQAIMLTVFTAVSVSDTVFEFTGKRPMIKWVNDLIIDGKKLSGILTEGAFDASGRFEYALVGIGINLYDVGFPDEIKDIATSLEKASGKAVDLASFAVSLAERLASFDPERIPEYMESYKALSLAIGKDVTVITAATAYRARVLDVNSDGSLKVLPEGDSEPKDLVSAEISIRFT